MKTMLGSRKHHYMTRVSTFVLTVALIAGMVGCDQPASSYNLTISSTAGGSVTEPGEGVFTYDAGMVVELVATPGAGYRFVNWTGDVETIANVETATTTIAMEGDYHMTADFEKQYTPMVAAGWVHTVGLKSDGTVVAVGDNRYGQCNVGGWDLN